ncbi:WXG100 family type VII secretion target [Olsenella sp. Marseille-P4559]|uniref:WXG100 family type VII secretion target n=1 Tax=Olsenella sp. Marseille-P4559 TaxID=2364795 RepID=UPI0013EEFDF6|nr:WXG100 family type VII secretion target [Olsenella sp. Marseille-P4559]
MSDTIVVNHAALGGVSGSLSSLSSEMDGQAESLEAASDALLSAWEGDGRDAFSTVADSILSFVREVSVILEAEGKSVSASDEMYSDVDNEAASSISSGD